MLAGLVFLFSCTKNENAMENAPSITEKRYPMHLTMKEFIGKVEPLPGLKSARTSSTAPAKDSALASRLYALRFIVQKSSDNSIVLTKLQLAADADFGELNDSLPAGNYKVSIAATTDSADYSEVSNVRPPAIKDQWDMMTEILNWPELFYRQLEFSVTPEGANELNVALNRFSAALEVNITDAPSVHPDSIVYVSTRTSAQIFDLNYGRGDETAATPLLYFPRTTGNTFYGLLVPMPHSIVNVTINYRDRVTGNRVNKMINNVSVQSNMKTVLTGRIFSLPPAPAKYDHGFNVSLNEIWDTTNHVEF